MGVSALEQEKKCRCGKGRTYDQSDSSYIPKKSRQHFSTFNSTYTKKTYHLGYPFCPETFHSK